MRKKTEAAGLAVRAADDGRQALQGPDRGRPGQGLRPRRHGRPRHGRGEGQPARLRRPSASCAGCRATRWSIRNLDAAPRRSRAPSSSGSTASPQSFHGLKVGIALGKALHRPVHAVAVYDPYLHYAMFNGIVGVLNEKASKIFRFKEQEQLHEEIIDTGLAKIYQSHLEIGRKLAADEGVDLAITLLDGKCFEKVLQFCPQGAAVAADPGPHRRALRRARGRTSARTRRTSCAWPRATCSWWAGKFYPPLDVKAEEIIAWTEEAEARMERVPPSRWRAWPGRRCSATRSSRGTRSSPPR